MKVRMKKRTPSGKVKIVEKRKRPSSAKCAICKKPLHGIPRLIPSKLRKLPKSRRRVERPYGGYLCAGCAKEILREKARNIR